MVTCNICRKGKDIEEMTNYFHYVCKECWDMMRITIAGEEISKELMY